MSKTGGILLDEYEHYYCEHCKKYIHFFKREKPFKGYWCWDCVRLRGETLKFNEIALYLNRKSDG